MLLSTAFCETTRGRRSIFEPPSASARRRLLSSCLTDALIPSCPTPFGHLPKCQINSFTLKQGTEVTTYTAKSKTLSNIGYHSQKLTSILIAADKFTSPCGETGGHSWTKLWAGGVKWAKFNVAATITDYGQLQSGSDAISGSVSYYNTANIGGLYAWHWSAKNGRNQSWSEAEYYSATLSGDIATTFWGGNWREPTKEEFQGLIDNCDWTLCDGSTTQYVSGCTLRGWKVSGKEPYDAFNIFLPSTGFYYMDCVRAPCEMCYYWTSTESGADGWSWQFTDHAYDTPVMYYYCNDYGLAVRPVMDE